MSEYAGKQFVGIDLHRQRSVIVRQTDTGEQLSTVRIVNDPVALGMEIERAGLNPEVVLEATDDSLTLARIASRLWQQRPHHGESLLKVSMVLGRLTHTGNYTPSLFTDDGDASIPSQPKNHQVLNESMDKLVQKFGRQSIYLGGAHNAIEAAPMRISFGHIPDLDVESD